MPAGGYQAPKNPAPVSGPGALSKRTDGGPTQPAMYISGLPYGQGQETYDQQTAAPMAGNPELVQQQLPNIVGLNEPTQFPEEPISFGADWGAGPTLSSVVPQGPSLLQTVEKAMQYDTSGLSELLYNRLNQ